MELKSTNYYVEKYRLNVEGFEFNREEFLKELGSEFKARVEYARGSTKESQDKFIYKKFRQCVTEMQDKFNAISNKKTGLPLTKKLWGAFYAMYIIPVRAELFPEVQLEVEQKHSQSKAL